MRSFIYEVLSRSGFTKLPLRMNVTNIFNIFFLARRTASSVMSLSMATARRPSLLTERHSSSLGCNGVECLVRLGGLSDSVVAIPGLGACCRTGGPPNKQSCFTTRGAASQRLSSSQKRSEGNEAIDHRSHRSWVLRKQLFGKPGRKSQQQRGVSETRWGCRTNHVLPRSGIQDTRRV